VSTHSISQTGELTPGGSIALVGHPNVGKSVLFQKLTGQFVTVSNYPGTTLEITRGRARELPETIMIDTPGVIAFPPHTEDEQVTAQLLLNEPLKGILQVGDAKNLRRTLLLTVQLAEMRVHLVLALNMKDEADDRGVVINYVRLAELLHLPVIPTTAVRGQGVDELVRAIQNSQPVDFHMDYAPDIESSVDQIGQQLEASPAFGEQTPAPTISWRAIALLWLSEDAVTEAWIKERFDQDTFTELQNVRLTLQGNYDEPLAAVIQDTRLEFVNKLTASTSEETIAKDDTLSVRLGHLATHPIWGVLILGIVLYSMYWFVGVLGAGILVDLLEGKLFGEIINPWVVEQVNALIPIPLIADLLVGEFGLWTMGMTYALALILPIVATFFIAFGVLEDSGYLPRLAALSNRFFQTLGLNGKAILPMVLGLGCVTMATLTTRILDSKRERILVTLFLALAVPCSAQLGVVMGMLAGISLAATMIWSGVVFLVLLFVGWLAARLISGERTPLLVELPPLRWPVFFNVTTKTLARVEWYLKEVIPLFLLGTLIMFAIAKIGLLAWLIDVSQPLVTNWLGLPAEASAAFLMGFIRRDFGATGFFLMEGEGLLTPAQVVVAMVTITLFVPCLASVMMIAKERGWRATIAMLFVVFGLAFLVGGLLYRLLLLLQWGL